MRGCACVGLLLLACAVLGCGASPDDAAVTPPAGAPIQSATGSGPGAAASTAPGPGAMAMGDGTAPAQGGGGPAGGSAAAPVAAGGAGTASGAPVVSEGEAPVSAPGPVEWTMFNYDLNNSRNNTSETKISVANVASLTEKWSVSLSGGVTSTPIVVGGLVYVGDHAGGLYALNAETGQPTWTARGLFQIRTGTPLVVGDIVYSAGGRVLYAHNRADGTRLWQVSMNDHANTMIDSSPILAKDKIVVGIANYEVINSSGNYSGRGAVFGATLEGMMAWKFWPTTNDDQAGAGVSVWSSAAVDLERNTIYIGTGQAYEQPAGPYSDALVALDIDDGMLHWANQFHDNDVYTDPGGCAPPRERPNCDWDIGASPNLFTVAGMPVVGVGSKGGLYRVIDRDTGTVVVWERQLGMGSALGGMMAVAAVSDRAVFAVANNFRTDSVVYAMDRETGQDLWQLPLPAPVWGAISYANGVLYISSRDGMLRAIDGAIGMELKTWDIYADAAGGVSISDGVVYVSSGFTGLGTLARTGARVTAFGLP
jgi:polyvinyl alcohol dehydrogenase (cytochrome)